MRKTILFYASVSNPSLFQTQKFYVNTIELLENIGYHVIVTNKINDSWKFNYDAIFCFFYHHSVLPAFVAKLRCKKVFFTGGLDDLDCNLVKGKRYWIQVVLFKICRWLADWCLVESQSDLKNINKICLIKNHKNIYYAPQAMDLNKYACSFNKKENIFSTICWQGTVGNVSRKGVDIALFYFKYLISFSEFSDSKFYIIGRNGDGTNYLKGIINELGLNSNVVITGEVTDDEKIDILKKSKYFFQLSQYEGFGLAALEALASSCIMIHSGRGGLNDTIAEDGVRIDITNFDKTMNSVEKDVYDRLSKIDETDINKMLLRIRTSFDEPIRKQNFLNTIAKSLPLD